MKTKGAILILGGLLLFSVPALSQYVPYYVLDGYGGVHAGGGAPAISPLTYYFGWDIAKSIDYVPVAYTSTIYGDGVLVLDGYGGIHKGGKLSTVPVTTTPYFGWNIARSLAYRVVDPQGYGTAIDSSGSITDTGVLHTIRSIAFYMPDAGYVMVAGDGMIWNTSATAAAVRYGIGIDDDTAYDEGTHRWAQLGTTILAGLYPCANLNTHRMVFLEAGQHYFYFLVQQSSGTSTLYYNKQSLSVLYFNKSWDSWSESGTAREGEQEAVGPLKAKGIPGGDGSVIK